MSPRTRAGSRTATLRPHNAAPPSDAADHYVRALQTGDVHVFLASLSPEARAGLVLAARRSFGQHQTAEGSFVVYAAERDTSAGTQSYPLIVWLDRDGRVLCWTPRAALQGILPRAGARGFRPRRQPALRLDRPRGARCASPHPTPSPARCGPGMQERACAVRAGDAGAVGGDGVSQAAGQGGAGGNQVGPQGAAQRFRRDSYALSMRL